jgi:hypothetical protein
MLDTAQIQEIQRRFKRFKGLQYYNMYIPGKYGGDAGRCKAKA